MPRVDRSQDFISAIETAKDIETLKRRAKAIVEMHRLERDSNEVRSQLIQQLFRWLWMLTVICGAGFLVNAGAIWWLRKQPSQLAGQSAL